MKRDLDSLKIEVISSTVSFSTFILIVCRNRRRYLKLKVFLQLRYDDEMSQSQRNDPLGQEKKGPEHRIKKGWKEENGRMEVGSGWRRTP